MNKYCFIAVLSLLNCGAGAAEFASYHIGNSLTNNMVDGGLAGMVTTRGSASTIGYHIRSGAYLAYIDANPSDTSIAPPSPYGNFANALPNYHWDAVTIQPYNGWPGGSTLSSDIAAIGDFVAMTHSNPANASTRFYMYAAWPGISLSSSDPLQYQAQWLRTSSAAGSQPTILAKGYFTDLYGALDQDGLHLNMIPVGEVLYAIDAKMRAGEIPGFSGVASLYRDDNHLNDLGCHLAAATAYSTMFAQSPVGLAYSSTSLSVDGANLAIMQQTVWDVVSTSSYTGVPEPASGGSVLASVAFVCCGRRRKA